MNYVMILCVCGKGEKKGQYCKWKSSTFYGPGQTTDKMSCLLCAKIMGETMIE